MTEAPDSRSDTSAAARRELNVVAIMLVAMLVVLVLAHRGTFSSMWFFPHIFGGIMAVMSLLSLRVARGVLWRPRLATAIVIVAIALVLPGIHVRGAAAKSAAYERRAAAVVVGTKAPPLPYLESLGLEPASGRGGGEGVLEPVGRVYLLNYWATWCAPCVAEMPMLEQFSQEHRELGIEVVGVTKLYDRRDSEAEIEAIEAFLTERGVTYPNLVGDRQSPAHDLYAVESLPATILVGRDGTVLDFGAGIGGTQRLLEQARALTSR